MCKAALPSRLATLPGAWTANSGSLTREKLVPGAGLELRPSPSWLIPPNDVVAAQWLFPAAVIPLWEGPSRSIPARL